MDNDQIIDEASEWFVTMREASVDAGTRERFMEWLRRSPEHVQAYLDTVVLWGDVPAIGTQPETSVDALIERARAANNIVPMPSAPARPAVVAAARVPDRRGVALAIAASAALVVAGLGALALWNQARGLEYETGIGEQRTLRLSDGSKVELNSRSRLVVHFSARERVIELVSGQALFDVAKDAQRPFLVSSDAVRVRAIGTRFDVNRRRDGTVVTVVEGRVAVAEVLVSAGQQVKVRRDAAGAPRAALAATSANTSAVTAWVRGELVFQSEALSAVVDEFNRYNARRIVIEDSVEDFPITATFATTDSDGLVKFLAAQPDLRVDIEGAEVRIRAAGAGSAQK